MVEDHKKIDHEPPLEHLQSIPLFNDKLQNSSWNFIHYDMPMHVQNIHLHYMLKNKFSNILKK